MSRVVVAGASVAGVRSATALRDHGHDGEIVLLDAEPGTPYDKPQLSKKLDDDHVLELLAEERALREAGVDLRVGVEATGLDVDARRVDTTDGPLDYDHLVVATGSRARPWPHPLPERAGYVRTRADWERLRSAVAAGGRLRVVGAGFLGLEAAAAASARGVDVTVLDTAPRVLARGIPSAVAALVEARLAEAGVRLELGVEAVELDEDPEPDGHTLVSIGALPNTEWLDGSGLTVADGVVCGPDLVAAPGVWAAGDCARWENARYGESQRHEHWTTAVRHAQHVARSIVSGGTSPMAELPYVWSDQLDQKIQAVGRLGTDELHVTPRPGAHVVLSLDGDAVTGATTINAPALSIKARRLLQHEDPGLDAVTAALGLTDLADQPVAG